MFHEMVKDNLFKAIHDNRVKSNQAVATQTGQTLCFWNRTDQITISIAKAVLVLVCKH